MEEYYLPLHSSQVHKLSIIINRSHVFLHCITIAFLIYYRLSFLFQQFKTSLLPWLLVFASELLLSFMWFLGIAYRWHPISRIVFPERLPEDDKLPAIDVLICTADPYKEPTLEVMNTVLSAMALDYPPQKLNVYLSDDGEGSQNLTIHTGDEVGKDAQETGGASLENNASFSSHISARSEQHGKRPLSPTACKETQTPKANMCFDVVHTGVGKSSCSDSVSSSHVRDATAEMDGTAAAKEGCQNSGSLKKMRTDGSVPLNSLCSDTIEAAILDLEELVNRIKWIKGILQLGAPLSNTLQPSWKFLEYRSSPLRK